MYFRKIEHEKDYKKIKIYIYIYLVTYTAIILRHKFENGF